MMGVVSWLQRPKTTIKPQLKANDIIPKTQRGDIEYEFEDELATRVKKYHILLKSVQKLTTKAEFSRKFPFLR